MSYQMSARAVGGVVAVSAVILVAVITSVPHGGTHAAAQAHFAYSGDAGPAFWRELAPEWRACGGEGGRQTPIDLRPATDTQIHPALTPLQLHLRPTPLSLRNNGHTLEHEYAPGSTLTFNGVIYDLLQFHFHTLSEHTIDGAHYPMEQHAVFRDARTGNLAVVGLFYRIGRANAFLAQFTDLPARAGQHVTRADQAINLAASLPATSAYFSYHGSLTTPPCSEIVTWFVLKTPAEMSAAQFDRAWRIMGNNFRPTQPRSSQLTVYSTP
jgi:carbonic anhydrase